MSESMRLANECKADRVDQFYAWTNVLRPACGYNIRWRTTVALNGVRFWG